MGFYFGGFGARGKFRPYSGVAKNIGIGAVGVSTRGTPWVKISGRRVMRELSRGSQGSGAARSFAAWFGRGTRFYPAADRFDWIMLAVISAVVVVWWFWMMGFFGT